MSDQAAARMLRRHIRRWRSIERRFTSDALATISIYGDSGRPAAVDRFIEDSLTTARRARRRAAELELRLKGTDHAQTQNG